MTRSDMDNDLARLLGPDAIPDEERSSLMAHLLADDEAMSLAADTAYVLRDLEAEDGIVVVAETAEVQDARVVEVPRSPEVSAPEAGTIPFPPPSTRRTWRGPPARWLALAAVLAGVLLIPLAVSRSGGPGHPGEYVALLSDHREGLPPGWGQRPWPPTRSAGDPLTDTDVGRAARLGVLWVDLELAARSGQVDTAGILCADVGRLLAEVPAGGAVGLDCARVIAEAPALRETGEALAALFEYEPHFALGAWGEAARVATIRQDAEFFASRRSRQALDRFATSDDLAPAARESAQQVRARLAAGAPDWAVLKTDVDILVVAAHKPVILP